MSFDVMRLLMMVVVAIPTAVVAQTPPADKSPAGKAGVAELFEDDAEGLLRVLTNPGDGPGKGDPDETTVFSGKRSIKISQYQRFQRRVPGWEFAIREKPQAGEYRYLRLAWKGNGCDCLMLQIHDATDWHIRYTAGSNPYGWATRFVADKPPGVWSLVTLDLFKDFGERTLTGIAFTIHGGAGSFDHVYLGRTIDDLDRIDVGGVGAKALELRDDELQRLWQELVSDDASVAYRAFWRMVAGRERSVRFIKAQLPGAKATGAETGQLKGWVRDLDSDSFAVREKAFAELKKHLDAATPLLEAALAGTPSVEAQRRMETLLGGRRGRDLEERRRAKALHVIEYIQLTRTGAQH
jgi:hypothetical protein